MEVYSKLFGMEDYLLIIRRPIMKRILLLISITTLLILGSSVALAKGPKEGKGKPATAGAKAETGTDKAAKEADAGEEKMKTAKEKAQKEAKAAKGKAEKEGKAAKEKAEKKAEEVKEKSKAKKEKAKAKGGKDDADDDAAVGKGKGKGKGQKGAAQAKQFEHEAQKHETRKARLAEMLKVAQDKGDDKAVGRIQKLIDREQGRYDKKHAKMTERGSKEAGDDDDGDAAENEDDE
jgi:hypothetical protein